MRLAVLIRGLRIGFDQLRGMGGFHRGSVQDEHVAIPSWQRWAAVGEQLLEQAIGDGLGHADGHGMAGVAIGSGVATDGVFADAFVALESRR